MLAQVAVGIDNFAIAGDGRLFVSHFTDGRVAEVTGGVERVLSHSGLVGPFGLNRMPDGSLITADALPVNRTDAAAGSEPIVIMSLLADLPGMAIDVAHHGDDPLVLLARGQVLRRSDDGRLTPIAGRLQDASSLTSARGGGAFLVERGTGRVLHLDGEGGVEPVVGGLDRPRAVAEAADGSLWISRAGGVTASRWAW